MLPPIRGQYAGDTVVSLQNPDSGRRLRQGAVSPTGRRLKSRGQRLELDDRGGELLDDRPRDHLGSPVVIEIRE